MHYHGKQIRVGTRRNKPPCFKFLNTYERGTAHLIAIRIPVQIPGSLARNLQGGRGSPSVGVAPVVTAGYRQDRAVDITSWLPDRWDARGQGELPRWVLCLYQDGVA